MIDEIACELCGELTNALIGCNECAKLICLACQAALPDDEAERRGDICEGCF
jgi:hypothetical protein